MDELEKFELLPDDEKIKIMKFYKLFSNAIPEVQLDEKIENAPLKSAGKQKTLDGWLLKSKGIGTTGHNSNSSRKNSEENQTNIESSNVSQEKLQDSEKGSDSKVLEFRQENTIEHAKSPGFISDAGIMNSENKQIPVESAPSVTEEKSPRTEKFSNSEFLEFRQDNTVKHDFVKKNPIVLVKRLDFSSVQELNSTGASQNLSLEDETSIQILSKLNTKANETPMPTSDYDESLNTLVNSPSKVDITEVSSFHDKQREAYYKLKKLCSNHELNLDDIFRAPEFKEMIDKYKSLPGSILFIGSHKCSSSGKVEPTLNFHKSKKKLLEALSALKTRNN